MKTKKLPYYKTTPRLIIRPLEAHDFENWQQAYSYQKPPQNEWDVTNWKKSELTLRKFKELLKTEKDLRQKDQYYHFGIFRKDDGVLLGHVSLMDISRGIFQNAYLGYRLFNNFWNQGFATEACLGALHLAFKNLQLHRVEAGISPRNKASLKVAKKIRLRKEGLSKKRLYFEGRWEDVYIFAMTKEDYN